MLFKGFEILDQMTGERSFFLINKPIENTDMKRAIVHSVIPQRLVFFSRQTFSPDFHSTDNETFGTTVETPANSPEEIFKIRLLPKLNWFEVFVFRVFLIHTTFTVLIACLIYLQDNEDYEMIAASTLAAGMIAPTVTQIVGFTYRSIIRTNYDFNCSPIKVERNQSSVFWTAIRFFYLITFFGICGLLSAIAIILIEDDFEFHIQYKDKLGYNDLLLVLILFLISLLVIYLLWLPLFCIIRFLCRLTFFNSPDIQVKDSADQAKDNIRDSIDSDVKSTASAGGHQSSHESGKSGQKDKSLRLRSNLMSTKESRDSGVDDNDMDEDSEKCLKYSGVSKTDNLNTGSVIVRPTKSLGYIDPENFKLSESRILDSKPSWQTTKPKANKN